MSKFWLFVPLNILNAAYVLSNKIASNAENVLSYVENKQHSIIYELYEKIK